MKVCTVQNTLQYIVKLPASLATKDTLYASPGLKVTPLSKKWAIAKPWAWTVSRLQT